MAEPPRRGFRAGALTALAALAVLGGVPGCAGRPVSPLPVRPPTPAASTVGAAAPPTSTAPETSTATPPSRSPAPTRSRTPRATPPASAALPSACLEAVRYDLVLAETELALLKSLCFATGGVLRIRGIGPGLVTVDREDLVSRSYEAGVVDIRFVRTGTVVVTIPQDGRTYRITVVVV
ncbi:hypothetical protein GCE86_04765 [Micromonospora terminaliae]|uniref:Uncharacterized protein n=1 Tax=Micromonospora terminaliae TaxID=1914461 RepID=A0AAJ3DL05_9ACTN|nr:hypothetical protein [Micromonospora terminaliae]NES30379.1 hypothetical protein [Micromonospora terminaliae]QGL46427.1 hypothetical protein GCE86_04765 [Micromonospora terminaliae]